MFFGSKKRHSRADGVSHPSDASRNEAEELKSRQWHAWRRSAQTVTRVWHEWLAANSAERTELFRRYVCALAEEERAATELECALAANGQHAGNRIAPAARGEASRFGRARGG